MILSRVKTAFLVPAGDSVGRGNRTGSEMMSSCRGEPLLFTHHPLPLLSTRPGSIGEPTPPRQGMRTLVCYIPGSFRGPGRCRVGCGKWGEQVGVAPPEYLGDSPYPFISSQESGSPTSTVSNSQSC